MDDRPLETPEAAIGRLDAKLVDVETTLLARLNRKPVGDIELAFRGTPKTGTLFMQGQTLNRADYPALWAWAQEAGAVVAGGYTVGNGTTTFTIPDMRNRFMVGAGGTVVLGGTGGTASLTLTTGNLPAHDHGSAGSHIHDSANGEMGSSGGHGGHFPASSFLAAAGSDLGLASWNGVGSSSVGGHSHFFTFDILSGGTHTHASVGSGTPVDPRPPYLGINVAVWF